MQSESDKASLHALKGKTNPAGAKRLERASRTGAWLMVTPDRMNGTDLSAEEFRDSLRLRFGLQPLGLPERCDGCHQRFSVGHAMTCKQGGLVLLRHNDIASEWHELCAHALKPSCVRDEPLIHKGHGARWEGTNCTQVEAELRGDVAAHGFWKKGSTAIFDIRVTDLEAPSQRNSDPKKVLARHETEKKKKYGPHCKRLRHQFTPLVFSVDGLMGNECKAALKCVAAHLAAKWKRTYSEVCGFVRACLALALAKSASRCLRWDRHPIHRMPQIPWDSGCGLGLFR